LKYQDFHHCCDLSLARQYRCLKKTVACKQYAVCLPYERVHCSPSYWNENHYITVIWQMGQGNKHEWEHHTQKLTKIVGLNVS
jgi:hypothetical protein